MILYKVLMIGENSMGTPIVLLLVLVLIGFIGLYLAIINKVRNKAVEALKTVPLIVKIILIIGGAKVIARYYF